MIKSLRSIVLLLAIAGFARSVFADAEMYLKIEAQKGKFEPIRADVKPDGSFSSPQIPAGDYKVWLIINDEQFKIFSAANSMHIDVSGQIVESSTKSTKKLRMGAPITPLPKPMPMLLGRLSLAASSSITGKITIANRAINPAQETPPHKK